MRVLHLSLAEFRNYQTAEVNFKPGANLLLGRNGHGKTNLVEAISYFATLSSHRIAQDTALIRAGHDAAVMRMHVGVGERKALLELQLNRGKTNRAQLNHNQVRSRELTRWFSCVMFAPEDLTLLRGEPSLRRRFLDEAVAQRNPVYAGIIADYERVVKQRTTLLKSARALGNKSAAEATLEVWNTQLVNLGVQIMLARRELLQDLAKPLQNAYAAIVQSDHNPETQLIESLFEVDAGVSRETKATFATAGVSRETLAFEFQRRLTLVAKQELERGVTLIGPHRDDVLFLLNDLPVKGYASHGETWSYALAVRLALAKLLRDNSPSGDPVIILDDVFAELDVKRREALMTEVQQFEQVIVTAAVEEDVPIAQWHKVYVDQGTVTEDRINGS